MCFCCYLTQMYISLDLFEDKIVFSYFETKSTNDVLRIQWNFWNALFKIFNSNEHSSTIIMFERVNWPSIQHSWNGSVNNVIYSIQYSIQYIHSVSLESIRFFKKKKNEHFFCSSSVYLDQSFMSNSNKQKWWLLVLLIFAVGKHF